MSDYDFDYCCCQFCFYSRLLEDSDVTEYECAYAFLPYDEFYTPPCEKEE